MISLDAARRHLNLLSGEADPIVSWQTFDDLKSRADRRLARSFHGRIGDVLPSLKVAQRRGAGVYAAVNATDGLGRRIPNMCHARALFLDLDGSPLPATWPVAPDLILHSSSHDGVDKFQATWLLEPTQDWNQWRVMQVALAQRYGGDPKCALVTQVGRVAGFFHLKRPDRPWLVRIVEDNAIDETVRWPLDQLVEKFGLDLSAVQLPAPPRDQVDRPPPPHGWDNPHDTLAASLLVADPANWSPTSDGSYSIFKMAARLRDLGISQALAVELIEQHVPALPASAAHDARYVERKVANAYRYASGAAGSDSLEVDRLALLAALDEGDAP